MVQFGQSESDYLKESRVTQDNIANSPEIKARLVASGYAEQQFVDGELRHHRAEDSFRDVFQARHDRNAISLEVKSLNAEVKGDFVGIYNRLRYDLAENPEAVEALGLNNPVPRTTAKLIEMATHFYKKAIDDPDLSVVVGFLGLTGEVLTPLRDKLLLYQEKLSAYKKLAGECQRLRVEKDLALKRLRIWLNALKAALKIAYPENLQTLEKVGFFVRSSKKKKKTGTETPQEEPGTEPTEEPGTEPGSEPGTEPSGGDGDGA